MRKLLRLFLSITAAVTLFTSSFAANVSNITPAAVQASPEESSEEVITQAQTTPNGRTAIYDEALALPQWNHNLMNIGAARQEGLTGAGITIAVLDTGFYADHPDMQFAGGQSLFEDDVWTNDHTGHGTHVAGIIGANANAPYPGVAPDASIYGIKVYHQNQIGEQGEPLTDISNIAHGIQLAADMGTNIILISSGVTANNVELQNAVLYAQNAGSLIIAAAGNGGPLVQYPAAYPEVVAVSSVDANLNPAGDIIYGAENELAAPGVGITSLSTPDSPYGYPYVVMSGSSQAAPHVAGLAALLMQKYGTDATTIRSLLHKSAYDLENNKLYGYGLAGFLSENTSASPESDEEETETLNEETASADTPNDVSSVEADRTRAGTQKRLARVLSQEDHEVVTYEKGKRENQPHNYLAIVPAIIDGAAQFETEAIDLIEIDGILFVDVGDELDQMTQLRITKKQVQRLRERNVSLILLHNDFEWQLPTENLGNEEMLIQYERVNQNWQNQHSFAYRFAILENKQLMTHFIQPFTFHFYYDDQTKDFVLYQLTEKETWQEYPGEIDEQRVAFQTNTLTQTFGLLAPKDSTYLLSTTDETKALKAEKSIQKSGISIPFLFISCLLLFSFILFILIRLASLYKNKNTL